MVNVAVGVGAEPEPVLEDERWLPQAVSNDRKASNNRRNGRVEMTWERIFLQPPYNENARCHLALRRFTRDTSRKRLSRRFPSHQRPCCLSLACSSDAKEREPGDIWREV